MLESRFQWLIFDFEKKNFRVTYLRFKRLTDMKENRKQFESRSLTARGKKATLPFEILESLEIPCGYERSFKMSKGRLLANRYLLGISLQDTTPQVLFEIIHKLQMPESLFDEFQQNLPGANLVFIGFEDDQLDGTYRVYLEYWDKICAEINAAPQATHPRLMFLGYKWNPESPERQAISSYFYYPRLSTTEIISRISALYEQTKKKQTLKYVADVVHQAAIKCPDRSFIYLEVNEEDNRRLSFDLNVYQSALRWIEIDSTLRELQQYFQICPEEFLTLKQLVGSKLIGHISAGTNREGEEFLTLYYEN